MHQIFTNETGKFVTILEDKHRFIVRLSHQFHKGIPNAKKRLITTLRIASLILVLMVFAGGYIITPKPISYMTISIAVALCVGLFIALDFVIFMVSKLLYQKKNDFDFVFDVEARTIELASHPVLYWTMYSGWPIFSLSDFPVLVGAQSAKLSAESVFTLREGNGLIELRSGLSQANVDFMFRVLDKGAALSLLAALNKVRELTLSEELPTINTTTAPSSHPRKPKSKKATKPADNFNPMD